MDRPGQYDPNDYAFIRATIADNPIYRNDADYLKALNALPRHLRQAFLEGDWNVFAGQYFDLFDVRRHTARAEQLGLEPWWPRWISIDWGFEHPSAVYWHAARPGGGVVTYRELVQNHLSPRDLAQAIVDLSGDGAKSAGSGVGSPVDFTGVRKLDSTGSGAGRTDAENISEIFLSPDAFAHHTSESTIAEQIGNVLAANGLPRPWRLAPTTIAWAAGCSSTRCYRTGNG